MKLRHGFELYLLAKRELLIEILKTKTRLEMQRSKNQKSHLGLVTGLLRFLLALSFIIKDPRWQWLVQIKDLQKV